MDSAQRIVESILDAGAGQRQLNITGTGSKRGWSPAATGEMLAMVEHAGVVAYDPAELVVTARAGTGLKDLLAELAQRDQTLAFEPPQFYGAGTVGGMVAAGLSGPARPWAGSVRDGVLGVELVNGLGEQLVFGGQVMKNVAGYDVSRLVAGAFGALGAILQVSLRVQPLAEHTVTLHFELDAQAAIDKCRALAQRYLPVSGTWWCDGRLYLRLAGSAAGVDQAAQDLGGERSFADNLWAEVRDQNLAFFKATAPQSADRSGQKLWRICVPPAAPLDELDESALAVEWAGGLRWLWHDDDTFVADYAAARGGWAWALGEAVQFEPLQRKYMRAIKAAFDPQGMFVSPLALGDDDAH